MDGVVEQATEEELCEDLNCLGGLRHLQHPPEKIKQSLGFWYTFEPDQDTKLEAGSRCYFAHDLALQTEIQRLDREQGRLCLKFSPAKLKQLPGGVPPERLSLIPDEYVRADVIVNSIAETATTWRETQQLSPALEDFLCRRPPRPRGGPATAALRSRTAYRRPRPPDTACRRVRK